MWSHCQHLAKYIICIIFAVHFPLTTVYFNEMYEWVVDAQKQMS